MMAVEQELMGWISKLGAENQRRVLEFVRSLALPQSISGDSLIERAHEVNFDPRDLADMQQAIEAGYERITSREVEHHRPHHAPDGA
jgi:hypothetical protein